MENKYFLDKSDTGEWLIKNDSERYTAGFNKDKAINLIAKLNDAHRPNILQPEPNCIYVCWGYHEKGEKCNYVQEI